MLEQDPRITEGPTFFQALYAWMKRAAVEVNARAPINSPVLTGDPQAPTPTNSDNDTSIATTAWVRSAMSDIASAAGFVFSSGAAGYIKLPSWLGGWIVQWSGITTTSGGIAATFPIAFPNAFRGCVVTAQAGGSYFCTYQAPSNSDVFIQSWSDAGVASVVFVNYLVWGH